MRTRQQPSDAAASAAVAAASAAGVVVVAAAIAAAAGAAVAAATAATAAARAHRGAEFFALRPPARPRRARSCGGARALARSARRSPLPPLATFTGSRAGPAFRPARDELVLRDAIGRERAAADGAAHAPSADAAWIGHLRRSADRPAGRPAVLGVPNVPPVGPLRPPAPVLAPPCLANRRCATGRFRMCSFIFRTAPPLSALRPPRAARGTSAPASSGTAGRGSAMRSGKNCCHARRARRRGRRHFLAVEEVVCGWSPHLVHAVDGTAPQTSSPVLAVNAVGGLAPLRRRAGLPDPGAREAARRGEL